LPLAHFQNIRQSRQQERDPNHGFPPMRSDRGANLPSERLGYLLRLSLGHVGHAAEV
jgi:hypothetical protein